MKVLAAWLLLSLVCLPGAAQTGSFPCEPSPAVETALQKASGSPETPRETRIAELRSLLQQYPEDLFVHRRYQQQFPQSETAYETALSEYRALLDKRPDNPRYLYLYGRMLIGKQTPEAIAHIHKALERAPDFPWAHLALAEIHNYPNFRDDKKLETHLEAFMRLCPSTLAGFSYLRRVENPDLLKLRRKREVDRPDAGAIEKARAGGG
jgi:tetratricopeptide (TPR) repeat protein